jgi:hypothetical protein
MRKTGMEKQEADRFRSLEEDILDAEGNLESAKEEVKAAKESLDAALTALRDYARELTNPTKTPLFPDGINVDHETGEITAG